jgi:hypothetical protein
MSRQHLKARKELLAQAEKELLQSRAPLYFNFVGHREDLLEAAVASVPSDICEVRVKRHVKPKPFTICLNEILKEVTDNNEPYFIFMHYDAQILDREIIIELHEEWKNRSRGLALNHLSKKSGFISACGLLDLLTLYDVAVLNDLGGWDEGLNNCWMEYDLVNMCHMVRPPVPYPAIYGGLDIPNVLSHKDASKLRAGPRNHNEPDNINHIYRQTRPRDFEYYYRKWPGWGLGADIQEMDSNSMYDNSFNDCITHWGHTEDVMTNINFREARARLLKLRETYTKNKEERERREREDKK